jgi:hypothetical protein
VPFQLQIDHVCHSPIRPAHGRCHYFQLQPPLGAQPPDGADAGLPPFVIEANADSFSSTLDVPHTGHFITETDSGLRTSFSNSMPHSVQAYS